MLTSLFRSRVARSARKGSFANDHDVFAFPGGVHLEEHKEQSNQTPITAGPQPTQLVLPLNMHLGAPAQPQVSVGDRVLKGQMIAQPSGPVSAALHAPTSGRVVAIGPRPIQHPSGIDALCIVLEPDGQDQWTVRRPITDHSRLSPDRLIDLLREAGVAGLGGAGFPTAVKVASGDHQRIEKLLINAAECEPYITADDRLMRERAEQIVLGIQVLQYLLNPDDTLIGIEDNKPAAIAALQKACANTDVTVRALPTKYPSGGEKQLIQLLTGKEVPSGSTPADCGVLCQNVGTAYAIKRAVYDGEPLLSRITTVTGDAVARPGNYEVWLGTPVAELLHHAGVDADRLSRLVIGGPMMGFTLHDPSVPLVKTSNCLIAASISELPQPPPEQDCIRCGACADVCPANLLPQQLYWHAKSDDFERAQNHNLMDCIECGACAYVCPSHIPLVQYYRYAKGQIRTQTAEQIKADRARERFEARQARLEQEKMDKEARRQARLEANRKKKAATASKPGADNTSLAALKKQVGQTASAYKAAVKAAKTAETQQTDNAAELRDRANQYKIKADQAKAALRDARAELDAVSTPATSQENDPQPAPATKPSAQEGRANKKETARQRHKELNRLKTAYKTAHKQYKEEHAALTKAEHRGSHSEQALAPLRAQVEKLKKQTDHNRATLNALMEQAKADILADTGKSLKILKLDAARTESALRDKAEELKQHRETADAETLERLNAELTALEEDAKVTRLALKTALEGQGLLGK